MEEDEEDKELAADMELDAQIEAARKTLQVMCTFQISIVCVCVCVNATEACSLFCYRI